MAKPQTAKISGTVKLHLDSKQSKPKRKMKVKMKKAKKKAKKPKKKVKVKIPLKEASQLVFTDDPYREQRARAQIAAHATEDALKLAKIQDKAKKKTEDLLLDFVKNVMARLPPSKPSLPALPAPSSSSKPSLPPLPIPPTVTPPTSVQVEDVTSKEELKKIKKKIAEANKLLNSKQIESAELQNKIAAQSSIIGNAKKVVTSNIDNLNKRKDALLQKRQQFEQERDQIPSAKQKPTKEYPNPKQSRKNKTEQIGQQTKLIKDLNNQINQVSNILDNLDRIEERLLITYIPPPEEPKSEEPKPEEPKPEEPKPVLTEEQINKIKKEIEDTYNEFDRIRIYREIGGPLTMDETQHLADLLTKAYRLEGQIGLGKGKVGDGIYSNQIDEVMSDYTNFKGAVPKDFLLKSILQPGEGLILNLDDSTQPGSHWVSVFINHSPDSLYYYDPLGDEPPLDILQDLQTIAKTVSPVNQLKLKINSVKNQKDTTHTCGWMAMNFLKKVFNGQSFSDATGYKPQDNSTKFEKQAQTLKKKFSLI